MEYNFTEIEAMVNEVEDELNDKLVERHALYFDYAEVLVIARALAGEFQNASERFDREGGSPELQFIGVNAMAGLKVVGEFILSHEILSEYHDEVRQMMAFIS